MSARCAFCLTVGALGLLVVCLVSGCASVAATVPEDYYDTRLTQIPDPLRDQVHVVLVESIIDPTSLGGLPSVERHLAAHGISHVSRFALVEGGTAADLADQVRQIRAQQPNARIMLVGWSAGTTQILGALKNLETDGTYVDSVVYLDSLFINIADATAYPANVGKNVLIYRHQRKPPFTLPNSDLYRIPVICHYSIPTEPKTLDIIHSEIVRLAWSGTYGQSGIDDIADAETASDRGQISSHAGPSEGEQVAYEADPCPPPLGVCRPLQALSPTE